jgi:hypothetical protein
MGRVGQVLGRFWRWAARSARRLGIFIAGTTIVVIGIILLALPGPGWLVIFAGLAVLASEFTWAERLLRFVERHAKRATRMAVGRVGFLQKLPYLRRYADVVEHELNEDHGTRAPEPDQPDPPDPDREETGVSS